MNRILACFLAAAILFTFSGCKAQDPGGVAFYYSRSPEQYQYYAGDGVIRTEVRTLSGHRQDLQYLVGLYLAGPLDESLVSPFPKSVRLLFVEQTGSDIRIELTDQSRIMSDSEFSLACACLTMTCTQFTDCDSVTVISADRTLTMNADSILFLDPLPQQETTGG